MRYPKEVRLIDARADAGKRSTLCVMGAVLDADARPDRVATLCPQANIL